MSHVAPETLVLISSAKNRKRTTGQASGIRVSARLMCLATKHNDPLEKAAVFNNKVRFQGGCPWLC